MKRFIAMMMAAAMIVTCMPSEAYAAAPDAAVNENVDQNENDAAAENEEPATTEESTVPEGTGEATVPEGTEDPAVPEGTEETVDQTETVTVEEPEDPEEEEEPEIEEPLGGGGTGAYYIRNDGRRSADSNDLAALRAELVADAETNGGATYTIYLNENMTYQPTAVESAGAPGALDYGTYADRVSIDLRSKTLTIDPSGLPDPQSDSDILWPTIWVSAVSDGTINSVTTGDKRKDGIALSLKASYESNQSNTSAVAVMNLNNVSLNTANVGVAAGNDNTKVTFDENTDVTLSGIAYFYNNVVVDGELDCAGLDCRPVGGVFSSYQSANVIINGNATIGKDRNSIIDFQKLVVAGEVSLTGTAHMSMAMSGENDQGLVIARTYSNESDVTPLRTGELTLNGEFVQEIDLSTYDGVAVDSDLVPYGENSTQYFIASVTLRAGDFVNNDEKANSNMQFLPDEVMFYYGESATLGYNVTNTGEKPSKQVSECTTNTLKNYFQAYRYMPSACMTDIRDGCVTVKAVGAKSIVLASGKTISEEYGSFEEAVLGIPMQLQKLQDSKDASVTFELYEDSKLTKDISLPSNVANYSLGTAYNSELQAERFVTLDLNGFALNVPKTPGSYFMVRNNVRFLSSASKPGTINAVSGFYYEVDTLRNYLDGDANVVLSPTVTDRTIIDNVNITSQGTVTFVKYVSNLTPDPDTSDRKYTIRVNGNITSAGSSAYECALFVHGNDTEYVFGPSTTVDVQGINLYSDAEFCNLTVRNQLFTQIGDFPIRYDGQTDENYEQTIRQYKANECVDPHMTITGQASIRTIFRNLNYERCMANPSYPTHITIDLVQNNGGSLAPLTISDNVTTYYSSGSEVYHEPPRTDLVRIRKVDSSGNIVNYAMNEKLATVNTASAGVFTLDEAGFGGNAMHVEKEGTSLVTAGVAVKVIFADSYTSGGQDYDVHYENTYSSFEKGIAAIGGSDFGGWSGHYEVQLLADCAMSKNITVPKQAYSLYITTPEDSENPGIYELHSLDMAGYTLSSAGVWEFKLCGGATLTNTDTTKKATITLTNANSQLNLDATSLPDGTVVINGININAPTGNGANHDFFEGADGTTYRISNSTLTTGYVALLGGEWIIDNINARGLSVGAYGYNDQNVVYPASTLQVSGTAKITEFFDVCSTATVGNLTLDGGYVRLMADQQMPPIAPSLTVNNLTATKASPEDNNIGTVFVGLDSTLTVNNTMNMKGGTFINKGLANIKNVPSVQNLALQPGSTLNVETMTMLSSGKLYMSAEDTNNRNEPMLYVKRSATIYTLQMGYQGMNSYPVEKAPMLARSADASISINGSTVQRANDECKLRVETVNCQETLIDTAKGTTLFTTNMTKFPVDCITLVQATEQSRYTAVMQTGNAVKVAADWIDVGVINARGNEVSLKTFAQWADAVSYMNQIANSDTEYYITISEDVETFDKLSLPTKAAGITIKSTEGDRYELKYLGDLTASVPLTFENVKLTSMVLSSDKLHYEVNNKAKIASNGKALSFREVVFGNEFASVNTTGNAVFELVNASAPAILTVTGNFGATNLVVEHYEIRAKDIKCTTTAYLESAELVSGSNISFKDLHSLDGNNSFTLGSAAANKLTVTGVLDTVDDSGVTLGTTATVTVAGDNGQGHNTAEINSNAISLTSTYVGANNYGDTAYAKTVFATGAKIPVSMMVIGRAGNTVKYLTRKDGNNLYVDQSMATAVALYGNNVIVGNYATLQEALTEIDRIGDSSGDYTIKLDAAAANATNSTVTSGKNLTMPKKLAYLTITVKEGTTPATITVKDSFTLGSNTCLGSVEVNAVSNKVKFALGNYELELRDSGVSTDTNITGIAGSNTTGKSGLFVSYTGDTIQDFTVSGDLKAATLTLDNVNLTVTGKTDVGNVEQYRNPATLIGSCKVTLKNGEITAITPNVTIGGQIHADEDQQGRSMFSMGQIVEMRSGSIVEYHPLYSMYPQAASYADSTGIPFAKALKADAAQVKYSGNDTGLIVKKNGFLTYTSQTTVAYELTDRVEGDVIPCFSFADAVTEINNRKNKNGSYTVTLTGENSYYSSNPESFTMPAAANLEELSIVGGGKTLYVGTKDNRGAVKAVSSIKLTANTVFDGLSFVDAEAKANMAGGVYPNRTPFTISLGGKTLVIRNDVTYEGRALLIDGGKGNLNIAGTLKAGKSINDLNNNYSADSAIEGTIKNVNMFGMDGDALVMLRYVSAANGTKKDSEFTVTTLELNENTIQSQGSIEVKDIITVNHTAEYNILQADSKFNITGTIETADDNLALIGRQDKTGKKANLNIKGTVTEGSGLIAVGLLPYKATYAEVEDVTAEELLHAEETASLEVAVLNKATADSFVSVDSMTGNDGVLYGIDPVDVFDPAVAAASRGKMLIKEKTSLKEYDGQAIHMALVAVDDCTERVNLTSATEVIGYYCTLNDAMATITSLKDKNAEYVVVILDDVTVTSKDALSYPAATAAAGVGIQSISGIKDVTIEKAAPNMTVDMSLYGVNYTATSISCAKGKTLTLNGQSAIRATSGTITLENVVNGSVGPNAVEYARAKNGNSNLKINGTVHNNGATELDVVLTNGTGSDYSTNDFTVSQYSAVKANKCLFTAPMVSTEDVTCKIADDTLTESFSGLEPAVVKSSDGFYYVTTALFRNAVGMQYGDISGEDMANYIDLNSALAQAKAMGDTTETYEVVILGDANGRVSDVNVTDTQAHSAIVMPATNTVGSIYLTGVDETTTLLFSGNISGDVAANGALKFESLVIDAVKPADKNGYVEHVESAQITLGRNSKDRTGEVSLVFVNTTVKDGCYIDKVGGKAKGVTDVSIDKPMILKTGFVNANTLTLNGNTEVVCGGTSTIGTLELNDRNSGYVAIGNTTVDYLKTVGNVEANADGPYVVSDGKSFKIAKTTDTNGTVVLARLFTDVKANKPTYKTYSALKATGAAFMAEDNDNYLGKVLLNAPAADASAFMAYPYGATREDSQHNDLICYLDNGNVICDAKANMVIKVTSDDLTTYAANYPKAIDAIKKRKDKTAEYTITFLETGVKTTTVNNKAGAFAFPAASEAAGVTIKGSGDTSGDAYTTVKFTGSIKPTVPVTLENVALESGALKSNAWTRDGRVTLDLSTASLEIEDNVKTIDANGDKSGTFDTQKVSGTKGVLSLDGRQTVTVKDAFTVGTLEVNQTTIESLLGKDITMVNVSGSAAQNDFLRVDDPVVNNVPKLKITGEVTDLEELDISLMHADGRTAPVAYTEAEVEAMLVDGTENAAALKNKAISTAMQKVPAEIVEVDAAPRYMEFRDYTPYKIGANLYITQRDMAVQVTDTHGYSAKFLTWKDAVNDIDKRGDKTAEYTMTLLKDIGGVTADAGNGYKNYSGDVSSIAALTLPKNAASVLIEDGNNDYSIIFTVGTVSVGTDTTIRNVRLAAQQKYTSAGYTYYWYPKTGATLNIAANKTLTLDNMPDTHIDSSSFATVTGAKLALENGSSFFAGKTVTLKDLDVDSSWLSAATNITVSNSAEITDSGDRGANVNAINGNLSVKNGTFDGVELYGNNVALTGMTTLKETSIQAINSAKTGQGKVTIADLHLKNGAAGSAVVVKQDASGKSLLTVSGNVTAETETNRLEVMLHYNNSSADAQRIAKIQQGAKLLTASKAAASWFCASQENTGIDPYDHPEDSEYGTYKTGTNVFWGRIR